jgi:hypothetical protein
MPLGYVREKFRVAVLALAEGDEPLRQRLAEAWASALCRLQADELPPDNRTEFSDMLSKIKSAQASGTEGSIAAGARGLTDDDAIQMVEAIVSIYTNVCRLHQES